MDALVTLNGQRSGRDKIFRATQYALKVVNNFYATDGGTGKRLVPIQLVKIKSDRVRIHSIFGKHFAGVPKTKSNNQVTKLEEEKICGYYSGGKLYASEDRQEPQLG